MKFNVFLQAWNGRSFVNQEVVFTGSKKACEGFTNLYKGQKFSIQPMVWKFFEWGRFTTRDVTHLDTRITAQHRSYAQHRAFISIDRNGTKYCFHTPPNATITQRGGTLVIDSPIERIAIDYKSLEVKVTPKAITKRYSLLKN